MSMEELYKQLDAVVESKTFSLEATKAIQELRREHETAVQHNLSLTNLLKDLKEENSRLFKLLDDESKRVEEMKLEVDKASKRESVLIERENGAAVKTGESNAYRNIFELMFKNTIVRESFLKGTVVNAMEPATYGGYETEKKKGRTEESTTVERSTI